MSKWQVIESDLGDQYSPDLALISGATEEAARAKLEERAAWLRQHKRTGWRLTLERVDGNRVKRVSSRVQL